jgi:hypothetical protein
MMKSDERVTGSVSPSEAGRTPDAEVKDTGNEAEGNLSASGAVDSSQIGEGVHGQDAHATDSPKKPKLSKEQQEWLNKVFIPNFRKELMRQVQFDKKVLEQHRRELERRKKDEEAQKQALVGAQEENEKLARTISELKIDRALISAAAANNAVNPDQVRKLLKDRVTLGEDLEPVVLDERGERQLNQNGEFMSVEEQVKLFLTENPHLVKASPAKGGSGSTGSTGRSARVGPVSSGDLIAEGLFEESKNRPTRTLANFEQA